MDDDDTEITSLDEARAKAESDESKSKKWINRGINLGEIAEQHRSQALKRLARSHLLDILELDVNFDEHSNNHLILCIWVLRDELHDWA